MSAPILQRNEKNGKTALMVAAQWTALDTIDTLLQKLDADANLLDEDKKPALSYGLMSNNLSTVKIFLSVTNNGLEEVFKSFAKSSVLFVDEIKAFLLEKLAQNVLLFSVGMKSASKFGNLRMSKLLQDYLIAQIGKISEENLAIIIMDLPVILCNSIQSDKIDVCKVVKEICTFLKQNVLDSDTYMQIAKKRGIREIFNLFAQIPIEHNDRLDDELIKSIQDTQAHIQNILESVVHPQTGFREIFNLFQDKTASILNMIPKTSEIPYFQEFAKMKALLKENDFGGDVILSFKLLLERMHVKKNHYDQDCPSDCEQWENCQAVREIIKLIEYMLEEIAKYFPIFKNTAVVVVGSLKENTKINQLDEERVNFKSSNFPIP